MADNSNRCVTYLKPDLRYVLDLVGEDGDHDCQAETIRELLKIALETLGYNSSAIRKAYLRYSLQCEESGKANAYVSIR